MIDALESLSKRLSADLEKAAGIKSEPAKPKRDILNGRFSCDLPKYVVDAWATLAREYSKLSGRQKTGETSADICEKLVADLNTLRVYLQAQLDEARKFPRV